MQRSGGCGLWVYVYVGCWCPVGVNVNRGFHIERRAVVFWADVKIPPLGSILNFDADVKKITARHPM